jgi:single-strand DNA-binding protein
MNNLNSILIEGNLVRDPLYRTTPKGTHVCTFSLASNRYYKQDSGFEKEVGFFDVETWARLADHCYSQGHKGRGVRVVGRLKQERWSSPEGKPRSKITIVAEHVEFRPEFKRNEEQGPDEFRLEENGYAEETFPMADIPSQIAEACGMDYTPSPVPEPVAF